MPGRSTHFVRRLESGAAGSLRLDDIRDHFAKLGAAVRVTPWWNGALLDRLLDERHAAVIDASLVDLKPLGWRADTEVTFSEWGERGSIDVFAAHDESRSVVVGEAKSAWGSVEETLRVLDMKVRLAPQLAERRFGFRPVNIGALLIFPEEPTARRVAQQFRATLEAAFPARNREIRRWLRRPSGPIRGLWFLSNVQFRGLTDTDRR